MIRSIENRYIIKSFQSAIRIQLNQQSILHMIAIFRKTKKTYLLSQAIPITSLSAMLARVIMCLIKMADVRSNSKLYNNNNITASF